MEESPASLLPSCRRGERGWWARSCFLPPVARMKPCTGTQMPIAPGESASWPWDWGWWPPCCSSAASSSSWCWSGDAGERTCGGRGTRTPGFAGQGGSSLLWLSAPHSETPSCCPPSDLQPYTSGTNWYEDDGLTWHSPDGFLYSNMDADSTTGDPPSPKLGRWTQTLGEDPPPEIPNHPPPSPHRQGASTQLHAFIGAGGYLHPGTCPFFSGSTHPPSP